MHSVSSLYTSIIAGAHRFEVKVDIGATTYTEAELVSVTTHISAFGDTTPIVGACIAGEIDISVRGLFFNIPAMAVIRPYVRAVNSTQQSEWLPKGIYYVDTRKADSTSNIISLKLHGFDAMLKSEAFFPSTINVEFPATDVTILNIVADTMDVTVDADTLTAIDQSYEVPYPGGMTCRETLGYIAAMYGGSFVMNDAGELKLIKLGDLPPETNYLVLTTGDAITFGGDRILV